MKALPPHTPMYKCENSSISYLQCKKLLQMHTSVKINSPLKHLTPPPSVFVFFLFSLLLTNFLFAFSIQYHLSAFRNKTTVQNNCSDSLNFLVIVSIVAFFGSIVTAKSFPNVCWSEQLLLSNRTFIA